MVSVGVGIEVVETLCHEVSSALLLEAEPVQEGEVEVLV